MIVGSRRKQRGALRTHDSAGEAPPQTKHKGEVGGSQKTAAASDRLAGWLAGGRREEHLRANIWAPIRRRPKCQYWRSEVESKEYLD